MPVMTVYEGDYVLIGENIRVFFDHRVNRDVMAITVDAPKDVTVLRDVLYEDEVSERAAAGDAEAQLLAKKLKKERAKKQREFYAGRARREKQERRMAAGEIKVYNNFGGSDTGSGISEGSR